MRESTAGARDHDMLTKDAFATEIRRFEHGDVMLAGRVGPR
jgi:hypothetical protein